MKAIDIAFLTLLASCSANHTKQPAELNNCTPIGDAGCDTHVIGGGSAQGSADSGASDADASNTTTDCNSGPVSLIVTMNMSCKTCAATSCCAAAMACAADCQALLSAVQSNCMMGNQACVLQQEGMYLQATVMAYQGFAQCVSAQCTPECPTLPQ